MKCELCGKDPIKLLLLPLHQPDGKLCTFTCEECARKSSAFCCKHNKIHQGFSDGSTACLSCVEELVQTRKEYALRIWASILPLLPSFEKEWLQEACELSSLVTNDGEEIAILRFIACKALRSNCSVEDVLTDIQVKHSVSCILFA